MRNLNIKIPGYKSTGTRPSRWITGPISFLMLAFFLYGFSDLSSTLAHIVFAQSPVSPVVRWLVTSLVLVAYALGLCVFVHVWRRGAKPKHRQRDEHDT